MVSCSSFVLRVGEVCFIFVLRLGLCACLYWWFRVWFLCLLVRFCVRCCHIEGCLGVLYCCGFVYDLVGVV